MLVLDLTVFHRKAHTIKFKEAVGWSIFWISLAAIFAVLVYFWRGKATALDFTTGYLIEESLSVDNLFVFLLIFNYFCVPHEYQHKIEHNSAVNEKRWKLYKNALVMVVLTPVALTAIYLLLRLLSI